ncbi:SepM family pheromone-processing serine protease [Hazenella coriacea]|uniref:endopeptidase La n=1 Tax=Hazenella coriacea TaxID=1179467 RepID=A0A4R3L0P9_9BACL|nr:SepM family pheromone-processing serine protease [Hazenella coriacea]TCS93103.1 PDZ domain-containing protein [Hazenella coriacea]
MRLNNWNRIVISALIIAILSLGVGISFLIKIPYYAIRPGTATDVTPYIQVGTTKPTASSGNFMLTTISIKEATIFDYLTSFLSDHIEITPMEDILSQHETEEEYFRRQQENMVASQNSALISSFREAKKTVSIQVKGVEVFQVLKNHTTKLQVGDLLLAVDQNKLQSSEQLIQYLRTKKAGDTVSVQLKRKDKVLTESIPLISLPVQKGEEPRAGLGVIPITRYDIQTEPPVTFHAEKIGGPSAGLMFSLEIVDRLLPRDLTHGYQIAGTGTISDQGEVGQIGGIQHKIVAADRAGAEYFLCPRDLKNGDQNEKIAKQTAEKIGTSMKVIPVSTLEEAIQFLQKLPAHSSFKGETLTDVA